MFAAMLFAISTVAFTQFGLYYWRAVLASMAALPVSQSVLASVAAEDRPLRSDDFEHFAGIYDLTPDLNKRSGGLLSVRFYYSLIKALETVLGNHMPAIATWTAREGAICARYAAVQVDQRLQGNMELVAAIRSC